MTSWLHLDWALVVIALWLTVGVAGVLAFRSQRMNEKTDATR